MGHDILSLPEVLLRVSFLLLKSFPGIYVAEIYLTVASNNQAAYGKVISKPLNRLMNREGARMAGINDKHYPIVDCHQGKPKQLTLVNSQRRLEGGAIS
ncbi:hypothetical protein KK060_17250 [Fulvivirgaceae bacterium PWU20]|uniref:Uncharacterized protein n=1 Tax=Chryseosolibacter indicus TaxID=2782351 RepID=A0ABS5VUD1_9BACT|nr:hypothetical protein [Chryseosolibacter indicus]